VKYPANHPFILKTIAISKEYENKILKINYNKLYYLPSSLDISPQQCVMGKKPQHNATLIVCIKFEYKGNILNQTEQ
jgi:hypothetical protein